MVATGLSRREVEPEQGQRGVGSWQALGASQVGRSHVRRGEPCADAFAIGRNTVAVVLAVADGAGSARCGGEGAVIAVQAAIDLALSSLESLAATADPSAPNDLIRSLLQETLAALLAEVARRTGTEGAGSAADFHTTLLLAILSEAWLGVGNIGDGWLVVRCHDGSLLAVAAPERGEYSNETFFLTSEGAIDDARIAVLPASDIDAVALLSDGSAWFAIDLDKGAPSPPLFAKLFAFAGEPVLSTADKERDLAAFLASEAVGQKTDDDTTLVLAVRAPDAAPPL